MQNQDFPIPSTYSRIIARVLELPEKELPRLLAGTGLATDILMPGDETYVSGKQLLTILENGQRLRGSPDFGLRLGQQLQLSAHGPLGYLALSSPDLISALEAMQDYLPTRLPFVSIEVRREPEWIACEYKYRMDMERSPQAQHIMSESFAMVLQSVVEEVLGYELEQGQISFEHNAPVHQHLYGEYLHSPFSFSRNSTAFRIPIELARAPNASGDSEAYRLTQQLCNKLLEQQPPTSGSMADQVRTLFLLRPIEAMTETEVAKALFVSKRTLARRLDAEHTNYRKIREQFLQALAQRYLLEPGQTVDSVAASLGYNDAAAFRKAFRRWTGITPKLFRQHIAGINPPG